eukprot:Gb_37353 [translate_table: standard]
MEAKMSVMLLFMVWAFAVLANASSERMLNDDDSSIVRLSLQKPVLAETVGRLKIETHAHVNKTGMERLGSLSYLLSFFESGSLSELLGLEKTETKVWPSLKFGWKIVVATIIGFVGSACGTVGGVGGGGIFVPMLNLIVGFDTKSAAALSKCQYRLLQIFSNA